LVEELMSMVLVIIIVAAWIVILGPSLMKRRTRSVGEIGSISHFHRQLRVLEHSAPEPIVAPAYRLRSVDGSGDPGLGSGYAEVTAVPVLTVVGAKQLPRPALAFLGEQPVDQPTDQPIPSRAFSDTASVRDRFRPPGALARDNRQPSRKADPDARFRVRRRRRDTLGVLAAIFIGTMLIGFVPGAGLTWVLTALSGAALVAYVGLLVHLRRMAEERERKLHFLRPEMLGGPDADGMVGASATMYGRGAHPSNQAAAAR
jgi:hypothetical protein